MLYSRTLLFIHSVYNSLYLLIPNSQSIPPPRPNVCCFKPVNQCINNFLCINRKRIQVSSYSFSWLFGVLRTTFLSRNHLGLEEASWPSFVPYLVAACLWWLTDTEVQSWASCLHLEQLWRAIPAFKLPVGRSGASGLVQFNFSSCQFCWPYPLTDGLPESRSH